VRSIIGAGSPLGEIALDSRAPRLCVALLGGACLRVLPDPVTGTPMCVPIGRQAAAKPMRNQTRESSSATPQASESCSTK
jgi:hypothetical protein